MLHISEISARLQTDLWNQFYVHDLAYDKSSFFVPQMAEGFQYVIAGRGQYACIRRHSPAAHFSIVVYIIEFYVFSRAYGTLYDLSGLFDALAVSRRRRKDLLYLSQRDSLPAFYGRNEFEHPAVRPDVF